MYVSAAPYLAPEHPSEHSTEIDFFVQLWYPNLRSKNNKTSDWKSPFNYNFKHPSGQKKPQNINYWSNFTKRKLLILNDFF